MEKNNKKGRSVFNLFDIAVILVALVLLGVLYYADRRAGAPGQEVPVISDQKTVIHYTVEVPSISENVADQFKAGDTFIDLAKKYILGTVESVEILPSQKLVTDFENKVQYRAEEPGLYTVHFTVTSEAAIEERNIIVDGGYVIRIGTEVEGKVPGCVFRGYVIAVERVDK